MRQVQGHLRLPQIPRPVLEGLQSAVQGRLLVLFDRDTGQRSGRLPLPLGQRRKVRLQ